MNDLATPFYAVFLSEHLPGSIDSWTVEQLEALTEARLGRACWRWRRTLRCAPEARGGRLPRRAAHGAPAAQAPHLPRRARSCLLRRPAAAGAAPAAAAPRAGVAPANASPQAVLLDAEADCYWCLSKLLEGVHDHYTDAQPGIQITVHRMKEVARWAWHAHDPDCDA
jgi:hypothetical protein